ncbi:hypothetical protein ACFV4T_04000 [Streptomyces sp. NPDC059755]|uniref:hypothetical protein n=1 Tax=Streptomyces sp. NPDC059755 TaxID=3346934 RepID=UPI00365BE639
MGAHRLTTAAHRLTMAARAGPRLPAFHGRCGSQVQIDDGDAVSQDLIDVDAGVRR